MQTGAHVKKTRNPNSCDLCKKKKVRCNSAQMPGNRCSECVSYNCECIHTGLKKCVNYRIPLLLPRPDSIPNTSSARSNLSGSRASSTDSTSLHPLVTAAIALLPLSLDSATTSIFTHISIHIFNLERQISALKETASSGSSIFVQSTTSNPNLSLFGSAPNDASQNYEEDEDKDSDAAQLAEQLSDLRIQVGENGKHFGSSSAMSLVGMALKVIAESNKDPNIMTHFRGIRRPTYWNLLPWELELHEDIPLHEFPPPDLMNDLIELFFNNVNVLFPLLHKPTFLKAVAANQHILDPLLGEVVLGACAMASRWTSDPRVLLEGDDVRHSAGWRWFRQIRLFRKVFAKSPSVYELQSNILAVLYLGGTSQPEIAWMLLGLGLRYAIEVGAHRKSARPSMDSELWKRAFWIMWCYEGMLASFFGRPRAAMTDDLDVDTPIDCSDEYWQPADPQKAFQQPANVPSTMSGFIAFIKLVQILEYAQANLFSIRASKCIASGRHYAQDTVAHLDSELNQWLDSIPTHLRWSNFHNFDQETVQRLGANNPTVTLFKQAAMLQCTYYHVLILAHRPFIFFAKPDSPMFTSSWAACTNAARAALKVINTSHSFINIHFPILTVAVISILEKWKAGNRTTTHGTNSGNENVANCLSIVSQYEDRWVGAGKLADVIRELMYLDELVSQTSNSPSPSLHPQSPTSGSQKQGHLKPEEIFSMATNAFPTFDKDFLGTGFAGTGMENDSFAMLF